MADNKMGASAYLITSGEEEREEALRLAASGRILAMPWVPGAPLPAAPLLEFWGIEVCSIPRARELVERSSPVAPLVSDEGDVVLALGVDEDAAKLFALHAGRRYLGHGDWSFLLEVARHTRRGSITVVGPTSQLSYELFHTLLSKPEMGATLGFLTGTSQAGVRWSVLKALLLARSEPHERELLLCAQPGLAEPALFEGCDAHWWPDLKAGNIPKIQERTYFLTSLLSHSNGVDGNFSEFILCPVPPTDGAMPYPRSEFRVDSEGVPSCIQSGLCQRDPEGKRLRFHPHSLRTSIALYDTCAGILTAGSFSAHDAGVGSAFLSGSCGAFITTYRKKSSALAAAVMTRTLLRDGHSLGTITRLLDRFQQSHFGELPSFILLGDPAYCLTAPRPASETTVTRDGEELIVQGWKSHVCKLPEPVDGALVPHSPDTLAVGLEQGTGTEWWLFRSKVQDEPARLRVVEPRKVMEGLKELEEPFRRNARFLETVVEGLRRHVSPPNLEPMETIARQARALLPALDSVRQTAHTRSWWESLLREFAQQVDAIMHALNALNRGFPLAWRSTRQWVVLHHYYTHGLDPLGPEEVVSARCPSCRSGLTRKRSANPHLPEIIRDMYTCIRCGVVADVPGGNSLPEISGPMRARAGETIRQRISLPFSGPASAEVEILAYFGGFGADVVRCEMLPNPARTSSRSGGVEVSMDLAFAPHCPPGLYSFVVVSSSLLSPIMAARYLTVEPRR